MRFLITIIAFLMVGCGSTPNRDDYAKHVNVVGETFFREHALTFSFEQSDKIDLRGIHNRDDSTASTHILYQGGAGLVGMFAQVGAHAAFVNSSRNAKLKEEQERANDKILPLINLVDDITLYSLLGNNQPSFVEANEMSNDTLRLKPIFFSNEKMNQLILKLVVWLPNEKGETKKPRYQNMIQVFSPTLSHAEQVLFIDDNKDDLKQMMSSQLNTAIHILQSDLTGKYSTLNKPQRTFTVLRNNKSKVVRGSVVDKKCGFQIVQNLHSWYVAFPEETQPHPNIMALNNQC
ncbi:hypothetical protein FX988_02574 [Paraglaciecola mesophila]|uniref:Lipoprotein n=1 Tax=Paraglaciecola mesophila TaxID=197222 RepID=A0A857JLU4_9ALTE|nr:hypothetical protein [Paraglaciecola mesophila]QHJ12322.1 hypothetical protein FX988_02574 [Paraglaciecola mesophila]